MPLMLHYRFLTSAQRTEDLDAAEVFLIPAYNFRPDPQAKPFNLASEGSCTGTLRQPK